MLRHSPKSPEWSQDRNGTWWRPATQFDTEAVPMDAADGYGFVLAGSPEEADRIDAAVFGEDLTIREIIMDAAKLACAGIVVALLAVSATGAAEWIGRF